MPDRENVIGHFQDAITASGAGNRWRFVRVDMIEDAITLLREQEPVEPHIEHDSDDDTWYYGCGACHKAIDFKDRFCRHCGRRAKWDDWPENNHASAD